MHLKILSEALINIYLSGFKLHDFVRLCLIYVYFLGSQFTINSDCLYLNKMSLKLSIAPGHKKNKFQIDSKGKNWYVWYIQIYYLNIFISPSNMIESYILSRKFYIPRGCLQRHYSRIKIATIPAIITENLKIYAKRTEQLSHLIYGILYYIWKGIQETLC